MKVFEVNVEGGGEKSNRAELPVAETGGAAPRRLPASTSRMAVISVLIAIAQAHGYHRTAIVHWKGFKVPVGVLYLV
jgi:hypothetical protein